jgi:hypothetical protein
VLRSSEFLRAQKRDKEEDQQAGCQRSPKDKIKRHGLPLNLAEREDHGAERSERRDHECECEKSCDHANLRTYRRRNWPKRD